MTRSVCTCVVITVCFAAAPAASGDCFHIKREKRASSQSTRRPRLAPVPTTESAILQPNIGNLAAMMVAPVIGMSAEKVGRTTGYTRGASSTPREPKGRVHYGLDDQVLAQGTGVPVSDSRDSESVIVNAASSQRTALL